MPELGHCRCVRKAEHSGVCSEERPCSLIHVHASLEICAVCVYSSTVSFPGKCTDTDITSSLCAMR